MPRAWYNTDRARAVAKRIGVFFVVIFALWISSFVPVLSSFFHAIEGGTYQAGSLLGRAASRLFANEDSLSAQLGICTERLTDSAILAASSEANAREVEEWRTLFGYVTRTQINGIAARIVARDTPEESVVTIDRGENDGIRVGAAVIIGDGALFGIVDSVAGTSSTVRLTEDPKSAIPAAILGKQKTIGLVTGREGALLAMEYIPQDTLLAVNDIVVTSGLGGSLKQGIVIGIVTNVLATPSAPFITASISPVHDPREWTTVLVLPYPESAL